MLTSTRPAPSRRLLAAFLLFVSAILAVPARALPADPDARDLPGSAPAALVGRVIDARSRRPVPAASVEVTGQAPVTTDEAGRFRVAAGPGPLAVRISRVGYRPRTWTGLLADRVREFRLLPELILLEGVTVTAGRMPLPVAASGPVTVIEIDRRATTGLTDPAGLLRGATGVDGRDYVNYTSLALRGTGAEHTLLALDGIRLNSPQSGTFDLTTLPVGIARRVEIARGGGSALYGSSPVGGTVNLITAEPERLAARLSTGLGAFGRRYFTAAHENRQAPLGYLVGVAADAAANDYPWVDDSGVTRVMTNADREALGVFGKGSWREAAHRLNLFGSWNSTRRGMPGPRNWPSDSARRDELTGLAYLRHAYEPDERLALDTRVSVTRSWQNYRDPGVATNDTHDLTAAGLQFDAACAPTRWLTLLAAAELDRSTLASTAVGNPSRLDLAGVGQARLEWRGLALQPALRVERLRRDLASDTGRRRTTTDVASPRVTLAWTGFELAAPYAAWGRSFRAPTFNDLFWPEDPWTRGNPLLRPEWSTNLDLGLRGRRQLAGWWLGWYRNSLTDLIQWRADSLFRYRPENVASATLSGLEAELELDLGRFGFSGNANWCRARSAGARLLYRPEFTARATGWIGANRGRFDARLTLGADWSGDRLTDPAYPDTVPAVMAGCGTGDARVELGWNPGPTRMVLSAGVRNLAGARFETVRHYPLPGRNWYAELGFDFR